MNLKEIKKLLREHGIKPKKYLDQHFLIDEKVLKQEVDYAQVDEEDTVLEIGPGIGTLTRLISERAGKTIVIEKDETFKSILEEIDGVEIIIGDALETEWPEFDKLISNAPYSISSPLVFKILEHDFESAVLCLQKEFAARMAAKSRTEDYSRLSVNCSVRANVTLLEDVAPDKYYPKPEVSSTILKMTKREVELPEKFDDIVRALFQHKNKKMRNALNDSFHEIGEEEEVKKFVEGLGIKKHLKVTNLKPEDIIELAEQWTEKKDKGK
ncbi:MAG: 16S rRNA (adenine(1518)-N(6)/adenine(1519)-N(6))-dimethyltransferase RsmA [Candidatus Undinarchaeales archaeon]